MAKNNLNLPSSTTTEKFVLGSILLDEEFLTGCPLTPDTFSLEIHRTIFKRILDLRERREKIDRITVANELSLHGELDNCGGLTYLVSLDDGLPTIPNLDSYVKIIQDKHALRRIVFLCQKAMTTAMTQTETADSILQRLGNAVTRLEISFGRKSNFLTPGEVIEEHGGLQKFATETIDPGESFGFPQLDEHLLGLQSGCQYLIGGRTSHGKSAMAMQIVKNLAKRGIPVAVQSLEMSKEILVARMVCSESGVPLKAYIKRNMMDDQRKAFSMAASAVADLPIYIDDAAGLKTSECCRRMDEMIMSKKIRVYVLDHLHKLHWEEDYKDEYSAFTAASGAFCDRARMHKISTMLLIQFNRPADRRKPDARPTLSDIRNTGALENDATGVIFVHRKSMFYPGMVEHKGKADIIIAKSRNGSVADCEFTFRASTTTFTDPGMPEGHEDQDET